MNRMASKRVAAFSRNRPAHRRGDGGRAGLADAAHRHAEVLGLDHDQHALRLEAALELVGDLGRQPFLHLRALGVRVDQPGQLRQPGDPAVVVRDVGDVGLADERHEVVLAHRGERDVAHHDHLVVVGLELRPRGGGAGDSRSPANTSPYIRATRPGVSSRPSRSGSSPMAARISRTAASMRGRSTGPRSGCGGRSPTGRRTRAGSDPSNGGRSIASRRVSSVMSVSGSRAPGPRAPTGRGQGTGGVTGRPTRAGNDRDDGRPAARHATNPPIMSVA